MTLLPEDCRNWKIEADDEAVLWLTLDRADREINTLSSEVMEELDRVLDHISGRREITGMVLGSGKKSGFAAGADVKEFSTVGSPSQACEYVDRVHSILDRLENLPFPTVCVIQGFCLGGGLELALACRYRIAVDTQETTLGLPEVRLGIHPGFGGTVRLTRKIGPPKAMDLMLSGRSIGARQAHRIGLADYVVPERQRDRAARTVLQQAAARKKKGFMNRIWKLRISRNLLSRYLRSRLSRRVSPEQYPAPYAIIDLWQRFGNEPSVMYREEARSVSSLITGDTARNLMRIFQLRERIRSQGRQGSRVFHSVHVIGAGTMGADIAAWCALQGMRVTLQDVEHKRLAKAVEKTSALLRKKLKDPRLVEGALDRFIPDLNGEGLAGADVVIEAIFEDASAKGALFREVEPKMRKDALLATNTSSIPLEILAESVECADRFVGLHFFNPVAKMQLVEVVRGNKTGADRLERAIRFVSAIRRLPLPVQSSPGFLVNRLLTPYILEAILLNQEGTPAEDIDRAAEEFGMPMGPLLLADTVGLDICLSVGRILSTTLNLEVPEQLETLVAKGNLGKKSGRGFYRHTNGKPQMSRRKRRRNPPGEDIRDRMILRLLNEAVACHREGIVSDRNLLDAGAVFGIGFAPFRGGPLHYARSRGVEFLLNRIEQLEKRYGKRFTPDPGWRNPRLQEPD